MIRTILTNPDKKLRQISAKIDINDVKAGQYAGLVSDMKETMLASDGIGLAAPQINEIVRIIVISTDKIILTLINPVITAKSWKKEIDEEGCLSVPGVVGFVKRHYKVKVAAYDENGILIKFSAKGLFARVIQHEIDHLDGVLFIDKAKQLKTTCKAHDH